MATLETACAAIATACAAVSGVRQAPALPPEQITAGNFPFVVTYPDSGTIGYNTPDDAIFLHNIIVEVHTARKDLPRDVDKIFPYIETIPAAIMADPTLSTNVQTIGEISYTFGEMNWGDLQTIGIRFTLSEVKLLVTV